MARPGELRSLAGRLSKPIQGSDGAREYGGHAVSARFLESIGKIDPVGSLAEFKSPTLVIHPEKDEHLSLAHPEDYYRAIGAAVKDKVIIQGADHTFSSLAWEDQVIRRSVEWFRSHLLPDSENGE